MLWVVSAPVPARDAEARPRAPGLGDAQLRWLYAVIGVSGSAFVPFYVLLLRDRGLSADEIGLVLSVTSLAAVAATPFWGHAADTRLGGAHSLQLACGAACVAALALLLTGSSILAIAGVAIVLGASQGPQTGMTDALALAQLGPIRITEYGSFRMWASVGWGTGSIVFGALFASAGLRFVLPVYAAGLAVFALFVGRFPRIRPAGAERTSRLGAVGDALRAPHVAPFLAGVLLLSIATHATWDFVPLRIVAGGGGAFLVGVSSGASAFVEIPMMRWAGPLIARFGVRRVFASGAAVYVAASIAWALVSDALAVTAVRIAIGVGFGLIYVTLVLATGRLVPDRARNSGQVLLTMCTFGLAPVIGGALGGFVYEHVGPVQLFSVSAAGIVVGAIAVWRAAASADREGRTVSV
jgi:MFS transporter, PPP family, 3-phenylpropionic acid transporter